MSFSSRFTHVIPRRPPASIAQGLRAPAHLRVIVRVPMPAGHPRTREAILAAGGAMREIGNSDCAKLDRGMSCPGLRLTPS